MRKLLPLLVVMLLLLIGVNALVVQHNYSRWGYEVGDYVEYASPDDTTWARTTVVQIEPYQIIVSTERHSLEFGHETMQNRLDKNTTSLFDSGSYLFESSVHLTYGGNESVITRWGLVLCQVLIADMAPYGEHQVIWMKNEVVVKGQTAGGHLDLSSSWELMDMSPDLRYRYLRL